MDYVQLLQLGFHGFAFALFCLVCGLFAKIAGISLPDELSPEQITARNDRAKLLLGTLKALIFVSLLFFILGVAAQVYSRNIQQEITLFILPKTLPQKIGSPVVMKRGQRLLNTREDGGYEIQVMHQDDLTIAMDNVIAHVERLEREAALKYAGMESGEIGE